MSINENNNVASNSNTDLEPVASHSCTEGNSIEQEAPYYDKHGVEIKEFAVLKVFHFIGARKKKHYMYKWVRIVEDMGKRYFYAQHLNDASGFFEKGSNKIWTGYGLRAVANPQRMIMDSEVVQQYN